MCLLVGRAAALYRLASPRDGANISRHQITPVRLALVKNHPPSLLFSSSLFCARGFFWQFNQPDRAQHKYSLGPLSMSRLRINDKVRLDLAVTLLALSSRLNCAKTPSVPRETRRRWHGAKRSEKMSDNEKKERERSCRWDKPNAGKQVGRRRRACSFCLHAASINDDQQGK